MPVYRRSIEDGPVIAQLNQHTERILHPEPITKSEAKLFVVLDFDKDDKPGLDSKHCLCIHTLPDNTDTSLYQTWTGLNPIENLN